MTRLLGFLLLAGCALDQLEGGAGPQESELAASVTACPAGTWCVESSPAGTSRIVGVWAASPDDVFAVGDGGLILRRTNDIWTTMTSGTTSNLLAVWGVSSSDVWACGASQTVLHFNGTAWSKVSSVMPTAATNAVWGSSATDVWFAGDSVVQHWNGSALTPASLSGQLLSISGTSPADVWVTGEGANVRHFDGTSWSPVQLTGLGGTHLAVEAIAPNDVWVSAANPGKETAHWDGTKWTVVTSGKGFFNGMSALGTNDVWGAGLSRRIGHWNGTAWTVEQPLGTTGTLWSVTTVPGHAWLVGDTGLIAHRSL